LGTTPKPVDGIERQDLVYAKHPTKGVVTVKVLAVGKHGFTAEDGAGARHKLHHESYLGHKTRKLNTYQVADVGADGTVLEDNTGYRRFLHGEVPGQDSGDATATGQPADPLVEGLEEVLQKALRPLPDLLSHPVKGPLLLFKALTSRPGLTLRDSTDRAGRHTRHWVRTSKEEKHPRQKKAEEAPAPAKHEHGDWVDFQHEGVKGHGKIVASGADGVTVEDEHGREHQVRHKALLGAHKLAEEHDKYFHTDKATGKVPMDKLVSSKTPGENEQSGKAAHRRMQDAAHGKLPKRDPISVQKTPDGKYKVTDGNGTLTAAQKAGWKTMPVREDGAAKAPPGPLFPDDKAVAKLPPPPMMGQPVKTEADINALTTEAQAQLEEWLDKGSGIAIQAGFEHVMESPDKVDLTKPGKMLFIGKPKSAARAREKVEQDYGGDWSKLLDPVRCSLACDTFDEVHQTLKQLRASGMKLARKPKDRFTNPTEEGYRDCLLNVTMPNGLVGEVQLHVKSMLQAKSAGHKWYEIQRTLEGNRQSGELSPEEDQKRIAAKEAQQQIYGNAWTEATGEKMAKALDPTGEAYTYFEHDNGYFRRMDRNGLSSIDDVLHGAEWVPYKGDRLKPAVFGDKCEDPTKMKQRT
jgi:hypothetical protein